MTFFYFFTSILSIVYLYTGLRYIPTINRLKIKRLAWLFLSTLFVCLAAHLYFRVTFTRPHISHILAWIGYTGLGLVSFLFCMAVIRDLALVLTMLILRLRRIIFKKQPLDLENPNRRKILVQSSAAVAAALSTSATAIGCVSALKKPEVIPVPIRLKSVHSPLKGLTIAQFSDLHVGPTVKYPYVKQVCETLAGLQADIIVFTGDLADGSPDHLFHDVSPLMNLNAPLGKYFITGNHEYYSGVNRWIKTARILGFHPLINEHHVIEYNTEPLTLAGVTDIRGGAFFKHHTSNPLKALQNSPKNSFKLLLAHQPTSVYEAAPLGVDLQLSGHTHGGQYFPFNYFIYFEHPFIKGMYQHKDTQLYVNQGTGYWGPPLRLGTVPEITWFTFR